jgi:glucose-1-phosphate cytidylyltransferase
VREQQLIGYQYDGFWASMDTFKDRQQLERLQSGNGAPWELWRRHPEGACSR